MVDFDPALVGRVFKTVTPVRITAEMIAGFCAVISESSPALRPPISGVGHERVMAPPGFAATFRALEDVFDHIPDDAPRLAAGMDVEFLEPIRAGDEISVTSQLAETYQKTGRSGRLTFFVIRSSLINQNGKVVALIDHRFTYRG